MIELKAYANPYAGGFRALDHKGRAHAYVSALHDPRQIHGGEYHHEKSAAEGTVVVKFDGKPFDLRLKPGAAYAHYRRLFLEGALVAADAKTAKTLGMKFVEPAAYIERCKAAAIAEWTREHGSIPACAVDGADDPAPLPAPEPVDPPSPPEPAPAPKLASPAYPSAPKGAVAPEPPSAASAPAASASK